MSNFKQILYFTFLVLLLNARHTLCHLRIQTRPKKCTCMEDQTEWNAGPSSHVEGQVKAGASHAEVQMNATQAQSKPMTSTGHDHHAEGQMKANATQDQSKTTNQESTKSSDHHAEDQTKGNANQQSKTTKSSDHHAEEQTKENANQQSKTTKSSDHHAEVQTKANATQDQSKPTTNTGHDHHAEVQTKVNATQDLSKPTQSSIDHHAEVQTKANGTQDQSKPTQSSNDHNAEVQTNSKANATQDQSKPTQSSNDHQAEVQTKTNATQDQSKPTQSSNDLHAEVQTNANATQELTKSNDHRSGNKMEVNGTVQAQHSSELQFMKWISLVGKLKHTSFKTAKNKVTPSFTLTVDKNAALGDFTCIQDAIDSLPIINLVRVVIKVHAGVYTEKISIPAMKAFISIEGAGADKTIIQWGDTAQTVGSNGKPLGTFGSATFAVNSPYFIGKNFTVKNTAPAPPPGAVGRQAVAFRISADTASFVGCKFLGAQDTLYDHLGRHYYKDCYIEGSVDFIFGNGLSMFENCGVHAIAGAIGAVTAQARKSILDASGFSFVNCKVTGSGALYLGRAWGAFSRVIFAYTHMDNIIISKGWYNWGDTSREMTVFYGQYKCSGAGANHAGRVPWSRELTDEEAKPFISLSFIDGSEWVCDQ